MGNYKATQTGLVLMVCEPDGTLRPLETTKGRAEITNPEAAIQAVSELVLEEKEHFVALYLDSRNRLIKKETVSIGTLTAALVHPREVFRPAVAVGACGVIVAHNHPSGDPSPSPEDMALTRRLRQAGDILGIELQDHLIIAEQNCVSLKEMGYL